MSKRHWFAGIAAGLVVVALAAGPFFIASIPVLDSLPQQTLAAPNCRYDEAVRAESDAYRDTEAAEKAPDASLGASEGRRAYEAAKRGTEQAKECEERARAWSDLWAQWQSAKAASVTAELTRLSLFGTGLEVLVLVAALGAASWAAWETRRATTVGRETGQQQSRCYVYITKCWIFVPKANMQDFIAAAGAVSTTPTSKPITIKIETKNFGQTPATHFVWRPKRLAYLGILPGPTADSPVILPERASNEVDVSPAVGANVGDYIAPDQEPLIRQTEFGFTPTMQEMMAANFNGSSDNSFGLNITLAISFSRQDVFKKEETADVGFAAKVRYEGLDNWVEMNPFPLNKVRTQNEWRAEHEAKRLK